MTEQHPTRKQIMRLVERVGRDLDRDVYHTTGQETDVRDLRLALLALLSEPTPPSITDMAPGTTFSEGVQWTVARDQHGNTFLYRHQDGYGRVCLPDQIDQSTIRDVKPPQ
jgi:hypothetical protein